MASMAGMFYIMSMYFYLKGRMAKNLRPRIGFISFCVVAGLIAMGSKENAFMLPVSIYLFDLFLIQGISKEILKKNIKIASVIILLTICISLTYYLLSQKGLSFLDRYDTRVFTLKDRLLSEPRIIIFYLTLIFYSVPTRLSIAHDITISNTLLNPPATLLSIIAIVLIVATALYISKRRPFIAFSIIFFFLNHIIESSVLPLELVFEHRNYIPSLFLFCPVAILMTSAVNYYSFKKSMQLLIILLTTCVIICQGHGTFIRNSIWKTEESLWMDATEKAPDLWRPYHNLGKFYADKNMSKKAISNYLSALTKRPLST
jgi:hypothetical protein